jgi:LuxR family maltose regulon positive regulatory protein
LLEHALQSAEAVGRLGNAVQILVVIALVHQAQGSIENAYSTLSRGLALAQPEGYIRVFLDEGEPMRLLIADYKTMIENRYRSRRQVPEDQKTLIDYTNVWLHSIYLRAVHQQIIVAIAASIPGHLTEQLEILRLMVAGLSNRDIADKDVASINTVKTQVKSIYGKLGVHLREDAIVAARELGLL